MALSLDEYRCNLINKILFAASQEEVAQRCDAAMKGLEDHKVNAHIIARFVDKIIKELDQFSPLGESRQQWSNIQKAKALFISKAKE